MTHDGLPARLWRLRYAIVYVALAARFVVAVASAHDDRGGFTPLIFFGGNFEARRLAALKDVPILTVRGSTGYDGQFYAQLAVAGNPFASELRTALDCAPYRARRIVLPLVAHLAGLGRAAWVLQIFALANLACWLALAWLLARWWFPPSDTHNLLRWVGTLFGAGLVGSVTQSLTDGPALLAIAAGVRALERNRARLAMLALSLAGLVRETAVLAASLFAPGAGRDRRAWARAALVMAACVAPTLAWALLLRAHYGESCGARNFAPPLSGLLGKLHELYAGRMRHGFVGVKEEAFVTASLAVQALFILARPQPARPWWRIGAAFAVLWCCLGPAVWEGPHSAVARAVLPLTLAFNVLAPRTRAGLALLLAGNLSVLAAPSLFRDVPSDTMVLAHDVHLEFGDGWYGWERQGRESWRWCTRGAVLVVRNEGSKALAVSMSFQVRSPVDTTIVFDVAGVGQTIRLAGNRMLPVELRSFVAPPGETSIRIDSPDPPWQESGADGRQLSVSLYDIRATVAVVR
jgi:hypothetical protein